MKKFLMAVGVAALALALNAAGAEARNSKCCCIPRVHVKHYRVKHHAKHHALRIHHVKRMHKRLRRYSEVDTLPPPPVRVRYVQAPEPEVRYIQAPPPRVVYVQAPPPPPMVRYFYRLPPPPPMRIVYRRLPPPMMYGGGYSSSWGYQRRVRLVRINREWQQPY